MNTGTKNTKRLHPASLVLCCLLYLLGSLPVLAQPNFRDLDWLDLLPESDRQLLEQMPELSHELTWEEQQAVSDASKEPWRALLTSTKVRSELNAQPIRIAGYLVPLSFDERVGEFFLVPYYGACIHVPPPPPNQMIYVRFPIGIRLDDLYTPFWIAGTLRTEPVRNRTGHAAYRMDAESISPYQEQE